MYLEIRKFYSEDGKPVDFHFQQIFDTTQEPAIRISDTGIDKKDCVVVIAGEDGEIDIARGSTRYNVDHPEYGTLASFVNTEILATLREHDKPFILYEGEDNKDAAGYITIRHLGSVVPSPIYN